MEPHLLLEGKSTFPMTLILIKICFSVLLVALGKVLTMGPELPEGYEDNRGFHFGAVAVSTRRFE